MEHPHLSVLQREKFIWSLSNLPLLEAFLHVLDGDPLHEVVSAVIDMFKTSVVPKRPNFRKCEYDMIFIITLSKWNCLEWAWMHVF